MGSRRGSRRAGAARPGKSEYAAPASPALRIEIVSPPAVRVPGLGVWLRSVAPARARGRLTVALVADGRSRSLNQQFRGEDRATDVLSFPAGERGMLGDVVIALGVARRQAREQGHSLPTEIRVLALHGLLHLLGYDHEHDDGRMARLEGKLRRKGGLPGGLIGRART
jgi:probable rRNA maturation factor